MVARSVCVFCGARSGVQAIFEEEATEVGKMLAGNGWRLVYGAGDIGLMGATARAAQEAGGKTFGVIPEHLMATEIGKADLSELIVTATMHERKELMFKNSNAIIVLPGGAGTLDEFFEVLTWRQLGLHDKPIFLLNTEDFWQPLIQMLGHLIAEGFAEAALLDYVQVVGSVKELSGALRKALS
ncbi:TIGR00730 family Rossman fold protein [uncultured Roseovarius sp.]|uniref:LOG family protein n=1 Tax=uncultured Roseovarius sp. TaxID=293344 RepID=UPI00260C0B5D|nr:TIGR00730 family Rossman fold protein [uncultured Roseovarius sp.]